MPYLTASSSITISPIRSLNYKVELCFDFDFDFIACALLSR